MKDLWLPNYFFSACEVQKGWGDTSLLSPPWKLIFLTPQLMDCKYAQVCNTWIELTELVKGVMGVL